MTAQPFKHKAAWMLGLLVFLFVVAFIFYKSTAASKPEGDKPKPATPVQVITLQPQNVTQTLQGIGSVEPLQSVVLRAQIDGILQALYFTEGSMVKKGELLARIDDRTLRASLQQAQAELARNQALLKTAEADLQRYQNLLKEDAIASQTVEQQSAQVAQAKAAILANQANIAATQVQLSFTEIRSPLNGRVGLRRLDAGNLVRSSDAQGLVTVTQLNPISVVFSLPQAALPLLKQRLKENTVTVNAYDRAGGQALAQGRLLTLDNQIDSNTGTLRLKAEFSNTQEQLWPGQFVTVALQGPRQEQVLAVPIRALQRGPEQTFVYRLKGDEAEIVPVQLGLENEDLAVITQGLKPGDRIVVDGQSRLKPNAKVRVLPAPGV